MFFKINAECHIGFKKLTAADLGIGTSHQTHIGLYEGVLIRGEKRCVSKFGRSENI